MSSKCNFTFENNPLGVYYAGQTVSGTAELITKRAKTIKSIHISINGFTEVRWTENVNKQNAQGKREKTIETFSSMELYYSSEKYVFGQNGGSQLELPAGRYVFPFQAIIPPNVPTSFNGSLGQIQHEVVLVIDRPLRYNNNFKQSFTVISPYDLNLNPAHANDLHKIEEKVFCWNLCCGRNGLLVMKVNAPFSGYAPGQKIRFHVVLDNQSNVHCSDVKVRLLKRVTYLSSTPEAKTKWTEVKLINNSCGEVIKHNKAEFNECLQIPSTTPSSLEGCSFIKISYTLKFTAKIRGLYSNLNICFPITIGTNPLIGSLSENIHDTTIGSVISTQPLNVSFNQLCPPPTFEEDVHSEQFENNKFVPRYPVYLIPHEENGTLRRTPPTVPMSPYPAGQGLAQDSVINPAAIGFKDPSLPHANTAVQPPINVIGWKA